MPSAETQYHRRRIQDIREGDFWSHLDPRVAGLSPILKARLSRRQRYVALAAWHGTRLAGEADHCVQEARNRLAARAALAKTRRMADAVLRHEIHGYLSAVRRFGKTIDFNADFGCSGQYGFHYLGWLRPVVDMYLLTDEPRYRDCLLDIFRQYYDQRLGLTRRIASLDPVYYELGAWAKTGALLPAYVVLAARGALDGADAERFLKLFLGFARSLQVCQKKGFRKGNWQVVGVAGLMRLARTFPEFREGETWRRTAVRIQLQHARDDFFPDGCHSERCFSYGWMTLSALVQMLSFCRRMGGLSQRQDATLLRCVRKAFQWYARLITPTGILPAYGDADLASAEPVLAAAREFFPPDRPSSNRLLGIDRAKSVILRDCGYAAMRDGAADDALYVNVNFGPTGGGHTHADLLDFNLWAFGQPLIEEVGRFDSYDNPLNPFFRSAAAHNQVEIDHNTMNRAAAVAQGVSWISRERFDFFSACHTAFQGGRTHPAVVRRNLLLLKGVGVVVYDVIESAEYIFTASFWLHSPRRFRLLGAGRAQTAGSPGCRVVFASPDALRRLETGVDVAPGEVTVPRLWPARYFLRARNWRRIQDHRPVTFAAALIPLQGRPPRASLECERDVTADHSGGTFVLKVGSMAWRVQFVPGRDLMGQWTCQVRKIRK